MYSINGVALQNSTYGWRLLRAGTNTQLGITRNLQKVTAPGRPGYVPAPSTYTEGLFVFVVRTPRAHLDTLLALAESATTVTRTDDATKMARVELASAIPESDAPFDSMHNVTITLSAYEGVWRDANEVTVGPVTIASPVQTITGFTGLSAPIYDMDFFLAGVFDQFILMDSGGSWIRTTKSFPGSSTTGLLFLGSTQQAYAATTSAPWTPTDTRNQWIDLSPHGGFRLTPKIASGNPASRQVELQLTTTSQTSVTLRVRARRAYRMN